MATQQDKQAQKVPLPTRAKIKKRTLITGGSVVTCNASNQVVNGDLLVVDDTIVAIGKAAAEQARAGGITRVIDATGCAVIPGFVQAHVHLCQTLFRGMADDMPLLEWLKTRIWPLEAAHDEESLSASAELGLSEMMIAGTTTILDMGTVHGYDAVMQACDESGIRAFGGKAMMDAGVGVPKRLKETCAASLRESDALLKRWQGRAAGRLGYAYAPRFILSCSEALFRGVSERSRENGALLHSHVAEHPNEREAVKKLLGDDDIAILRKWGFFGKRTVLAHGVQLRDDEAKRVAKDGTRIVHCPSANLKLGSGIARIAELDEAGVQLALGADGAPCNNNMDPWMELRHAALLAKSRSGTTKLPASRAFRLATIDGAKALGIDRVTGSLEPGKKADLAIVNLGDLHAIPGGDVMSRLVYACTAKDVRFVFASGTMVAKNGEHLLLDRERVIRRANDQGAIVKRRAKI